MNTHYFITAQTMSSSSQLISKQQQQLCLNPKQVIESPQLHLTSSHIIVINKHSNQQTTTTTPQIQTNRDWL